MPDGKILREINEPENLLDLEGKAVLLTSSSRRLRGNDIAVYGTVVRCSEGGIEFGGGHYRTFGINIGAHGPDEVLGYLHKLERSPAFRIEDGAWYRVLPGNLGRNQRVFVIERS